MDVACTTPTNHCNQLVDFCRWSFEKSTWLHMEWPKHIIFTPAIDPPFPAPTPCSVLTHENHTLSPFLCFCVMALSVWIPFICKIDYSETSNPNCAKGPRCHWALLPGKLLRRSRDLGPLCFSYLTTRMNWKYDNKWKRKCFQHLYFWKVRLIQSICCVLWCVHNTLKANVGEVTVIARDQGSLSISCPLSVETQMFSILLR